MTEDDKPTRCYRPSQHPDATRMAEPSEPYIRPRDRKRVRPLLTARDRRIIAERRARKGKP